MILSCQNIITTLNLLNFKLITMYCKCGKEMHSIRINLGYRCCVNCSTTKTYSYIPIIEHKTGNTIQIVSQELSAAVHKSWRRK
jgi:hypothetical protein